MSPIETNPALQRLASAKAGPMPVDEPSFLAAAGALREQQVAEIKRVDAMPDVYSAFAGASGFLSGGTRRPLTKTQLLCRQPTYTRRQLLPSNFTPWLCKQPRAISEATTVPLIDLLATLETEQPSGLRFVAVCKNSTRSKHVLTVLDLAAKKFYRATSATGMVTFLKGAARRWPHVQVLQCGEDFAG
jgi:hypothetical protein